MKEYKMLIVDDEEIIRKGITIFMERSVPQIKQIIAVESAEEALQILESEEIDILMTDICMDRMSGLDLIEYVNQRKKEICIIVLTGYDRFEYAQKCCKMDVQDFLLKPIDETLLKQAVLRQIAELQKKEDRQRNEKIMSRATGLMEQISLEEKCRKLLEGTSDKKELNHILREYGYEDRYRLQIVVILPILEKSRDWKENHQLLYLSVKNICISMFDMKNLGITFEDHFGRICLLLFCRGDFENGLKELKYILNNEFDMPVTLLLGSRVEKAEEVCYSYNEAIALMEVSHIHENEVLITGDEEKRLRMFRDTVYELRKIMEENLDQKDTVLKAFSTFAKCTDSYNLSDSMVRKETFQILSGLLYEYVLCKGEMQGQLEKSMDIILSGTREEILAAARDFIESTFFREMKKSHLLVEQAKTYINSHLAEELSVTSISEQLFVSISYFSRLFKLETGEGCNEYIVRMRMEKAKTLLETTTLRVGAVAAMAGYKDMNYFSLAYKKFAGCPPSEYREKYQGRGIE